MQVRGASTARRFEAGHFCDREPGAFGAQEELSFDLETGSGKAQGHDARAPERSVAIAQVRARDSVQESGQQQQRPVAYVAHPRDVDAPATGHEARAPDEIVAIVQRLDEAADLPWVHASVGVEHHDEVAGRRLDPLAYCTALTRGIVEDDHRVGPDGQGHLDRPVGRAPVHEHYLVHVQGHVL
jgi:hypothetical protein